MPVPHPRTHPRRSSVAARGRPRWAQTATADEESVTYRRVARTHVRSYDGPLEISLDRQDNITGDRPAPAPGPVLVVVDGLVFDLDQARALRAALTELLHAATR
jgi:hypothetical protein